MFLEDGSVVNHHMRSVNFYGKTTRDVNKERRWAKRVNSNPREKGGTYFNDRPCSGRPVAIEKKDKTKQHYMSLYSTLVYSFF